MRRLIIKSKDEQTRTACTAALQSHREKFGEHQANGRSVKYKVKVASKVLWIEVTACSKSYVAKPC